jgi:coproporphyrinogen III oxidase-like Fe-S oxidoreductase
LALALALGVDHLSLYQLTIEPRTRFHELRARGRLANLPDGEVGADLYEATQGLCAAAGLPAYEISNHARPGREGRHNRIYWRYGDYVGVGPGAHGRLTIEERRKAVEAVREPEAWLAAVENLGSGEAARATLDGRDQAVEMLIMGLRLVEGISIDRYTRLAGRPLPKAELAALRAAGFVEIERGWLRASISGRQVLEAILECLISDD